MATVFVVLALGGAWAMGAFDRGDPQVAELEQLRDENFKKIEGMSGEERRKQFGGFRDKMRDLSEEQRRQFFESSRPMIQQMMNQRLDAFFAMSPEEQEQELDKRIDQMEERSEDRGDRGGDRGGSMTSEQRDQRRKEMLDRTTPELRGKWDRYRDLLNDRRNQRGLGPATGRGGFGGRG